MKIRKLEQKLELAKKNPKWVCRHDPSDGFHEVGCPHLDWTKEQLMDALLDSRAMVMVYEHELYKTPLDGGLHYQIMDAKNG